MRETLLGLVQDNKVKGMSVAGLMWWERERLLTARDREEIGRAERLNWADIDEARAETEAGKYELHSIKMRKYHNEEYHAGIL